MKEQNQNLQKIKEIIGSISNSVSSKSCIENVELQGFRPEIYIEKTYNYRGEDLGPLKATVNYRSVPVMIPSYKNKCNSILVIKGIATTRINNKLTYEDVSIYLKPNGTCTAVDIKPMFDIYAEGIQYFYNFPNIKTNPND